MTTRFGNSDIHFNKEVDEIDEDGVLVINRHNRAQAKFPDFCRLGIQDKNIHH